MKDFGGGGGEGSFSINTQTSTFILKHYVSRKRQWLPWRSDNFTSFCNFRFLQKPALGLVEVWVYNPDWPVPQPPSRLSAGYPESDWVHHLSPVPTFCQRKSAERWENMIITAFPGNYVRPWEVSVTHQKSFTTHFSIQSFQYIGPSILQPFILKQPWL